MNTNDSVNWQKFNMSITDLVKYDFEKIREIISFLKVSFTSQYETNKTP